ncbi:hypothetical protein Zmor_015001 [Zophobas morio]|uniref:Putative nuclease HARBI1 n=1 Tax=Zophobas morio TaxID=2755281 RepID=A0AA38IIH6_9CUCU|nr:hypothetical protein Zmor_015001 [Zophobas morio]
MARYQDFLGDLTDDEDFLELLDEVMEPRLPRIFRNRIDPFEIYNDKEFKRRYRLSKDVTNFIINEISPEISSQTDRNHALSASEQVIITLRFLATGAFLKLVGDHSGVDESTTSRVITKVIFALARIGPQMIQMPRTEAEKSVVRQGFYNIARFPRCVGALDCTDIKILSPGGRDAEVYRNRKSFFSYNVQAICDANLKILDIVTRWPGSAHDSYIFANSRIKHRFENGEFGDGVLLGDKGYAVTNYLITPLRTLVTPAENLFNQTHIWTRNPIERCFGVLKRRFPVLALGIRLKSTKIQALIVACAVLHNVACELNDEAPDDINEDVEREIAAAIIDDDIIEDNRAHNVNNIVRQTLINQYFENLL